MRKLAFVNFLLVFCLTATINGWVGAVAVFATGNEFTSKSTYDVNADGSAIVTHEVKFVNGEKVLQDDMVFPTLGVKPSDVVVQSGGGDLQKTVDENASAIKITIPENNRTISKEWDLRVSYKSQIINDMGKVKVLQIAPLAIENFQAKNQTESILADLKLGFGIVRGMEPNAKNITIGKQVFDFVNDKGPLGSAVTILFGESTLLKANYETTLTNNGWWWRTMTLALPPDTNQQKVVLKSIAPKPSNLRLDEDGNVIAEYKIGPKKSLKVTAEAELSLNNVKYDLKNDKKVSDIDKVLVDRYTKQTDKWKYDALSIDSNESETVVEIIQKVYNKSQENTDTKIDLSTSERTGALTPVDKLVGTLRGKGIPARVVLGLTSSNGSKITIQPKPHAWAEAYVPAVGWITLDPTMGSKSEIFGTGDILHTGMALWGIRDDFPPVDFESIKTSYSSEDPGKIDLSQVKISAVKYQILPGLAILDIGVSMPPGGIIDKTAVQGSKMIKLGSLAPLQTIKAKSPAFLGTAYSKEDIKFGILGPENEFSQEVASTKTSLNFLPMIVLTGIVFLGVPVTILIRRSKKKKKNKKDEIIKFSPSSDTSGFSSGYQTQQTFPTDNHPEKLDGQEQVASNLDSTALPETPKKPQAKKRPQRFLVQ